MRRGAATVVALVGEVREGVARAAARARNVTLVEVEDGPEAALRAMERAEGVVSPYALVEADPLEDLARGWQALWAEGRADEFERAAAELLERAGRLLLPDYYLVLAREPAPSPDAPHPDDFYLGVLASVRPARVAAVTPGDSVAADAARVVGELPRLRQGPWWPDPARLVEATRGFFPGALSGTPPAGRS